jgi:hypothetical protein
MQQAPLPLPMQVQMRVRVQVQMRNPSNWSVQPPFLLQVPLSLQMPLQMQLVDRWLDQHRYGRWNLPVYRVGHTGSLDSVKVQNRTA